MKKFSFNLERKQTIWKRTELLVDAENEAEALEIVKKQIEAERNPFNYTDKNITVYDNELLEDTTEDVQESGSIIVFNDEWETVYEK